VELNVWHALDRPLKVTFATVGACGALLVVAGGVVNASAGAASVATGVILGLSNLYVLSMIVRSVVVPAAEGHDNARFAWTVFAVGKMMLLLGGVWLLMTRHLVEPIELLVGYGSLPIGIAIGAVVSDKVAR
jgi:hypothetical protein